MKTEGRTADQIADLTCDLTCDQDRTFMLAALEQAKHAADRGEVPVGAIVVVHRESGAEVAYKSGNTKEGSVDPLGHAEILALRGAAEALGRWRLSDCTLYVTLEPCVMCAGAIVQSRIGRVVFGASDPKAGAVHSLYEILSDKRLNHRPEVISGILANECGEILSRFFAERRGLRSPTDVTSRLIPNS